MTAFRFIHASDLHLGRRFANIPQPEDGNIRGRLMEARHGVIARLAQAARDHGAAHVLLAGDTFDTATPSPSVLRQALTAMAEDLDLTWWLLPGNHDNLTNAEPLWERLSAEAPATVRPLLDATPRIMTETACLLPAPVTHRAPGRDLTEGLGAMPSPDGAFRIALAHGGVTDFEDTGAHIPPDRAARARLDYLALGDWHGRLQIDARTHYPGTPEQDRFKHGRRGLCLAVSIEVPGATPEVTEVETGQFWWTEADLPVQAGLDTAAALDRLLPPSGRRDVLMRVRATGWASLAQRADLVRAIHAAAPDFAWLTLNAEALGALLDDVDLDTIDHAGALRQAAETLKTEAENPDLSAEDRGVAAEALARLYAYVTEQPA
ncbi:DNA repair exonuclease [uncultured Mameliella sp.]|uniref:metallophosphoesterase family protein n=1 Tax=uncultured Mameliella sp. TaxID=1447087 RepID=UPI00260772BB|nr:DNA repair exonuclease [uncultured Mameliella sp.]